MRVNPCKLALFAALSLLAPVAFARTHRPAARPDRATVRQTRRSRLPKANKTKGQHANARATNAQFARASPTSLPAPPVRHNRKHHAARTPELPSETRADERHSRSSPPASRQVSVISLIRKSPDKPQVLSIEEQALTPVLIPALFTRRGRLIMPAALKGSHAILLHQNEMADHDGLDRIQDDDDLLRMRATKTLVPIPASVALQTDERLPTNRRYCRPWTARFMVMLAKAHYARFRSPLQVNSAVRTVEFQQKLLQTNGNAAPAEGQTASPHLTGQAIDLAKHGLSLTEIAWLRGYLRPLVQEGKIDVEEEFQQSCFHISVYRSYIPATPTRGRPGMARRAPDSSLRAALR